MDPVEFLTARLDEDEQDARLNRGVFPSPGVDDDGCVWLHIRPGGNAVIARYAHPVEGYDDMAKLRNWADTASGWTQARVLAEVDAKRRVVGLHGIVYRDIGWLDDGFEEGGEVPVCGLCVPRHSGFRTRAEVPEGPCPTLRLLALPYADHPDYDEAWRP